MENNYKNSKQILNQIRQKYDHKCGTIFCCIGDELDDLTESLIEDFGSIGIKPQFGGLARTC